MNVHIDHIGQVARRESAKLILDRLGALAGDPQHVAGEAHPGGLGGQIRQLAQVQVRLRAVIGDEHLAVLKGAHGAGVHIEIGVELLVFHPEAPLLQQPPQGRRADALSQPGHHAAGNKNMLHRDHSLPAEYHIKNTFKFYCRRSPPSRRNIYQNKESPPALPCTISRNCGICETFSCNPPTGVVW